MDIEGMAFRLVGALPAVAVMIVGVWLAFHFRWKNPRGCTLLGVALLLAMGVYVVLPVISHVVFQAMANQFDMDVGRWRIFSLVQTLIFSVAWSIVWGLVLFAIFGRNGLLQPPPETDEDYN